jgi:hypothetical protein
MKMESLISCFLLRNHTSYCGLQDRYVETDRTDDKAQTSQSYTPPLNSCLWMQKRDSYLTLKGTLGGKILFISGRHSHDKKSNTDLEWCCCHRHSSAFHLVQYDLWSQPRFYMSRALCEILGIQVTWLVSSDIHRTICVCVYDECCKNGKFMYVCICISRWVW